MQDSTPPAFSLPAAAGWTREPAEPGRRVRDVRLGDCTARYRLGEDGRVELCLLPAGSEAEVVAPRRIGEPGGPGGSEAVEHRNLPMIPEEGWPGSKLSPLVQLHARGDDQPGGFAAGQTLRGGPGTLGLTLADQRVEEGDDRVGVVTTLRDDRGLEVEHTLAWLRHERALRCRCRVRNGGDEPITLEHVSAFNLGGVTPFARDDAPGRLRVHRFRSRWGAEGFHRDESAEDLMLLPSWLHFSANTERFGQVGSMPVRGFHPFVGVEDRGAGVTWAATLACPGSWQIELQRLDDRLAFGGGWADQLLGHWARTLGPGEVHQTPEAFLTVCRGGIDEACDRLLDPQETARRAAAPASEEELPIVFNEWCTTWGKPSHERMEALADRLEGSGVSTLVIDAGWYRSEGRGWGSAQGDWVPSPELFPGGIEATAGAIRARGLTPGIWFEFEVAGAASDAASEHDDLFLKRHGRTVVSGGRRFWDFTKPEARELLRERMIGRLRTGGFGFLKVDYNESIGVGADHPGSLGEGLRVHLEAVQEFWREVRRELPDLVIENCSSGGHRLEPSMNALASVSSFSDAHEPAELPLVAANLQRLIPPRQSLVWGVLHPGDDADRIDYTLAACFLGRMCLSGGVEGLAPDAWRRVLDAVALYREAAPVIARGTSRRHGELPENFRHPEGWQAVVRVASGGAGGDAVLVVAHRFGGGEPERVRVPLLAGGWDVTGSLGPLSPETGGGGGGLALSLPRPFTGGVVLLRREERPA